MKLQVVKKGRKFYSEEIPYSTNEVVIGIWIDGKKIYRKVVSVTINDVGYSAKVLNDWQYDTIINMYGTFKENSRKYIRNFPHIYSTGTGVGEAMSLYVVENQIRMYLNNATAIQQNWTFPLNGHVILEYTKPE